MVSILVNKITVFTSSTEYYFQHLMTKPLLNEIQLKVFFSPKKSRVVEFIFISIKRV